MIATGSRPASPPERLEAGAETAAGVGTAGGGGGPKAGNPREFLGDASALFLTIQHGRCFMNDILLTAQVP